ncbi:Integrase family protein [Cupriavidus taiwanensis]|uniref:Integrase family protein n=1 Tax=Cupriavidus taiwanensis TaxID=164546 RepID=A0A375HAQ6_9BURK|nr:site-specific integrase [Cupriavidus taiwanensis]SOZ73359.1 Integrase family protein [Cupriavidus taiwanensis]SOZ73889.1 Integrase family protein [Cupriavidus taiwanensis]SOZ75340.1 Integrase family protein [Cupriavidus taiwanensis]SPA03877.1 Integrase family protein [Cupriavidus taiwanensis]SPA12939.1 Integrase family protein [Cupriavidus taiwanensis]
MSIKRAKTLKPSQIRHLLRVTAATSRHPERDELILLLGFTCGMRVSEIARIEVADVLMPAGKIREEVSLRPAITKGCRQRCIYLSHPKTVTALQQYIERRWAHYKGTAMERRMYRGLMPQTCLTLTHKGGPYELSIKRRTNEAGEKVDYLAADSLQSYVTGLYRRAGLGKGYSSHSGRRTFASRLLAQGHSIDTVQLLLGHSHIDHVAPYLEVTERDLLEAAAAFDTLL